MSQNDATSVLVTGATGNQGGAVVDHLLDLGDEFDIYGLTRDADSEPAQDLEARGVTMVEGDLLDEESLRPHVEQVDSVFAVTNFWTQGYENQVQQGKNIADVAADVGVDHFVFSGVASHDEDTGIPHFDSAWEIEQHIHDRDLPATIIKPVFFYQNFEVMADDILDGTLAFPLEEGVSLQMVDVDDVGYCAAYALANPAEFIGESYDIAGDELTLAETAEVFSEVTGVDVDPYHVPIEDAYEEFGEEFAVMCEWFNEVGYSTDIDEIEAVFDYEVTTLPEYLFENGWEDKEGPASIPGWAKAM